MNNFAYTRANSIEEAVGAAGTGAAFLAGGTDLIPLIKEEIVSPSSLIDVSALSDEDAVQQTPASLRIPASTSLSAIAAHPLIQRDYTALAQACNLAATPQLRNMGTIGGNLLQQTRCWYYRGEHHCWLKGGETCFARGGENELHAIFLNAPAQSMCVSAHPTDPGVALLALDATVAAQTASGALQIPIAEFFALPTEERRNFNLLPPGALITHIDLPAAPKTRSLYIKAMPRATWAFALASIAMTLSLEGGTVRRVTVALGGVAPVPLRASWVEERLAGSSLNGLDGAALADELVAPATPLSQNGYKVALLRGLFMQALDQLLS